MGWRVCIDVWSSVATLAELSSVDSQTDTSMLQNMTEQAAKCAMDEILWEGTCCQVNRSPVRCTAMHHCRFSALRSVSNVTPNKNLPDNPDDI